MHGGLYVASIYHTQLHGWEKACMMYLIKMMIEIHKEDG